MYPCKIEFLKHHKQPPEINQTLCLSKIKRPVYCKNRTTKGLVKHEISNKGKKSPMRVQLKKLPGTQLQEFQVRTPKFRKCGSNKSSLLWVLSPAHHVKIRKLDKNSKATMLILTC